MFNIHPVLLGSGIPLFHPMVRQIDLKLMECRVFKNGCVFVSTFTGGHNLQFGDSTCTGVTVANPQALAADVACPVASRVLYHIALRTRC